MGTENDLDRGMFASDFLAFSSCPQYHVVFYMNVCCLMFHDIRIKCNVIWYNSFTIIKKQHKTKQNKQKTKQKPKKNKTKQNKTKIKPKKKKTKQKQNKTKNPKQQTKQKQQEQKSCCLLPPPEGERLSVHSRIPPSEVAKEKTPSSLSSKELS